MNLYRRSFVRMLLVFPVAIAGCQSSDGLLGEKHSDWMTGGLHDSSTSNERPSPKVLPATYYAAGKLFEKQGQLEQAARKYSEAITVNHEYLAAYNRLGIVLTQLGRFDKADEALIRAIELAPDRAFLRNNLAFSYILQKRWADAEAELVNALHLNPNFVRARVNMGMVQAKQSRFADAFGTFRTVLPEADAYYNMGMLFNSLQRFRDAAAAFERAKMLQPAMTSAQTQLDALASRLAEPRPNEPRAVFTKDGIADAAIDQESPADVPEMELVAINELEFKPETMPELKVENELKVAESVRTETPQKPETDANDKEVASVADPDKESASDSLETAEKLVTEEGGPQATKPKQAASDFVGPPTPRAEDFRENEQELVLNFEHDRPDLAAAPKKLTHETSPSARDQVAQTNQQETIDEVVMAKESSELEATEQASTPAESRESKPGASSAKSKAEEAEPSKSKASEKDADKTDEEQLSSADIDSDMEDEANEEQVDPATPDADSQPAARTLVTVTVQPQISSNKNAEANADKATNEQVVVVAEPNTSPALEELMVDHADHENQEEALVRINDDSAEASNDQNEQAGDSIVDASLNKDASEFKETSSTSGVSGPEASSIVQGRKNPIPRRRSKRDEKVIIALYFDHHRPDFTYIPSATGGESKGDREMAGRRNQDGAADVGKSDRSVAGQSVAAVESRQSIQGGDLDGTDDPKKTSPVEVTEPQTPETSAASINKAPIRIMVTQRKSDEVED